MHAAKVCSDGEMMRTGIEIDDDGKGGAEAVLCCAVQKPPASNSQVGWVFGVPRGYGG